MVATPSRLSGSHGHPIKFFRPCPINQLMNLIQLLARYHVLSALDLLICVVASFPRQLLLPRCVIFRSQYYLKFQQLWGSHAKVSICMYAREGKGSGSHARQRQVSTDNQDRPGSSPCHRGSLGALPRIARREKGSVQTNETFRVPAAPFDTVCASDCIFLIPLGILRSTSASSASDGCI